MADDDALDELIRQFSNITGIDGEQASFYLDSAAWNLEAAVSNFYETDQDIPPRRVSDPVDAEEFGKGGWTSELVEFQTENPTGNRNRAGESSQKADEGSEEEKQASQHGESENGQADHDIKPNSDSPAGVQEVGSVLEEIAHSKEAGAGPSSEQTAKEVEVTIKVWKNGFSVNSGPLLLFDDPKNREFLESLKRREVPRSLRHLAKNGEVCVVVENHKTEEFVESSVEPFSGTGHRLGSVTPQVLTSTSSKSRLSQPVPAIQVDVNSSKPVTSIQIRLSDGQRMVEKFNLSHTVGDIRNFIVKSHPQYASKKFILMTNFPNKELTEEDQTIEEAGLANTVIVQMIK